MNEIVSNEWGCQLASGSRCPEYSRGCNPLSRSLTNDAIKQATAFPFAFARLISATLLLLCEAEVFEKHYVLKLILACASQAK